MFGKDENKSKRPGLGLFKKVLGKHRMLARYAELDGGGGQTVASYSDDPSLNLDEVYRFDCSKIIWRERK